MPRSNRITGMGELQLDVLDKLCRLGEATVYDVLDEFPARQRPRYTTVLTVLRNLEQKGLATHRARDRTYVFRPTDGATEVRSRMLEDVLERVFGGSPKDLMAAFLDVDAVTPDVLRQLKALIAKREAMEADD